MLKEKKRCVAYMIHTFIHTDTYNSPFHLDQRAKVEKQSKI